jgi:hypothetical protein
MVKDMVGQEIRAGQNAVWSSYGRLWTGRVLRVSSHRALMQRIGEDGVSRWRHMPLPHKVMIVSELPKQTLFWAMRG